MLRLHSLHPVGVCLALAIALVGAITLPAAIAHADSGELDPTRREPAPGHDPLVSLVRRVERYLRHHEVDGVTMDWRYQVSPSEEIRQTVVCQVLAYAELYRLTPRPRLRLEVMEHADFLIGRLEEIRSHSPFDGMLAYSLLAAYEATGEPRFLTVGSQMVGDLLAIPTRQCVLNGGLMVAMATAQYWRLTGSAAAEQKTRDILAQLVPYQNPDGSFPHWCPGSIDIHYTGWMSMELIHIQRMLGDPHVAPILERATRFLEGHIALDGRAIYQEPCPGDPGCTRYYYSRATGCGFDYDTRGWTVEPAYCVLAFDHAGSSQYQPVMRFLLSLENGGRFPDLYGYWPPPDDPEYPWTIADTSVVNMSIIFWALTTAMTDRAQRGAMLDPWLDDEPVPPPATLAAQPLDIQPNPAPGSCALDFALAEPTAMTLVVYDAGGRRVRVLESGVLPAGMRTTRWDGRDEGGRAAPNGVYFARLCAGRRAETLRFVLVR